MGDQAFKEERYGAAASYYEKADFAEGTDKEKEKLATAYEMAGKGRKAMELRRKIRGVKKKK